MVGVGMVFPLNLGVDIVQLLSVICTIKVVYPIVNSSNLPNATPIRLFSDNRNQKQPGLHQEIKP